MQAKDEGGECPVCLDPYEDPVETNCAHKYCGECIINVWETSSRHPLACQCPYCRREVNLLMPVNSTIVRDRQLQQKINDYNSRMGSSPIPITTQVMETPTILRHVYNEWMSSNGLSYTVRLWVIVLLLIVLVYFISPIDLIPELVFGRIGYIDDFGSIIVALVYLAHVYRKDMSRRVL